MIGTRPRPRTRLWRTALSAAAVSFLALLTACSAAAPKWHPVTTEESQILAITRFQNFDAGARGFTTELTVQGQQLKLQGSYDFAQHIGYASVAGRDFDPQALLWNGDAVALRAQSPDASGAPLVEVPAPADQGWNVRALAPNASSLDAFLSAFAMLATDRPDNPLLVQQAGALWLGSEKNDSKSAKGDLQLFAGPPSDEPLTEKDPAPTPETATVRYAIDDGGLMHRVELLLGKDWVTVHFTDAPEAAVPTELAQTLFA